MERSRSTGRRARAPTVRRGAVLLALVLGTSVCTAVIEMPRRAVPVVAPRPASPPAVPFRDPLAPYGAWRDLAPYGWVWSPDREVVGDAFMPYVTGGAWQPTDRGWMWMSVWDWGWIPFHHGRWLWQPPDGWMWIPDTRWAPAWVAWRASPGLVGWAPLPPLVADGADRVSFWVFVPRHELTAADVEPALLPLEETPRALALSAPLRELGEDQGHSWFIGPRLVGDEWPLKVVPPGAEDRPAPPPNGAPPLGGRARSRPNALHGPLPPRGAPGLVPPLPPDVPR